MGMAALGKPTLVDKLKEDFFDNFDAPNFKLKHNLHNGCRWWETPEDVSNYDIAASVQAITEEYLVGTAHWMKQNISSENFVFMGGCALNCVANSLIAKCTSYKNVWIMPNPGDAGSAIGAIAALERKQLTWTNPYLGTNINRVLDVEGVVNRLISA
jgi:carbamoyltransferase